jgi:outer membrane receptor protein involved in Fe transport
MTRARGSLLLLCVVSPIADDELIRLFGVGFFSIRTLEFNSSLDLALSSAFSIKIGGSYQRIQYDREYVSSRTIEEVTNQYNYPDTAVSLRNENADNNSLDTVHAGSHKLAGYLENIVLLGDQIILNVGGRFDYFVNILSYSYEFDNQGNPVVKAVNLWPILPTLGLSVGF